MTVSIQTDDFTYTDTTFTVTITGTNSALEDITQSFDVTTQDCSSAFTLDSGVSSTMEYIVNDAMTSYDASSFFLSTDVNCVAALSISYNLGATLDDS